MALVITTKYRPATATKGTRIQATTSIDGRRQRLVVAYDHALDASQWERVALDLARRIYAEEGLVPTRWMAEWNQDHGVLISVAGHGVDRSAEPDRSGVASVYEEGVEMGRRLEREAQRARDAAREEREEGYFAQEVTT